jgi:ketosteroid isomerase-like protein
MASAAENKEIVRAAYEGMATGNPKAFFGALDPEIVIIEPDPLPYGGTYKGQAEVMEFMKGAAQVIDAGSKFEVETLTADEDRVVATLRVGLHSGGESLLSEHWTMRDGKAIELRVFCFDPTAVAAPA